MREIFEPQYEITLESDSIITAYFVEIPKDRIVIERKLLSEETWTFLTEVEYPTTEHIDVDNLINNANYQYRAKNIIGGVESEWSELVNVQFVAEVPIEVIASDIVNLTMVESATSTSTLSSTDINQVTSIENIANEVSLIANDSVTLSILESANTTIQTEYLDKFDTLNIIYLDSAILEHQSSGVDPPFISIDENTNIEVGHSTSDSSTLTVVETANIDKDLEVSDSQIISIVEFAEIGINEEFLNASDNSTISTSEITTISMDSSVIDSGVISIIESSNISTSINATDQLNLTLQESTTDRQIHIADNLTLLADEQSSLLPEALMIDGIILSIVESTQLDVIVENNDTSTITLQENVVQLNKELFASDSFSISSFDTGNVDTTIQSSDIAILSTIELAGIEISENAFTTVDNLNISVVESSNLSIQINTSDVVDISVTENISLNKEISVSDTIVVNVVESADMSTFAEQKASNDQFNITMQETSSVVVEINATDTLAMSIVENTVITSQLSVSDEIVVNSFDNVDLQSQFISSDSSTLSVVETTTLTVNNSLTDIVNMTANDVAATNVDMVSSDNITIQYDENIDTTFYFDSSDSGTISLDAEVEKDEYYNIFTKTIGFRVSLMPSIKFNSTIKTDETFTLSVVPKQEIKVSISARKEFVTKI